MDTRRTLLDRIKAARFLARSVYKSMDYPSGPVCNDMHKIDMLRPVRNAVLEARCAQCGKKAHVDDEMENVKCEHCGYSARYEDYLETMKDKALLMADDFQMSWDKNPL